MSDINTLRKHLFDTLSALQDKENPMDIDRARAVSELGQTIINSAKVEIDHMKLTGSHKGSGFIPFVEERPEKPQPFEARPALSPVSTVPTAHGVKVVEQHAAGQTTTHRMR